MLKPDTSYSLVLHQENYKLNSLVVSYIKHINKEKKIYEGNSLLGKSLSFDDKAIPSESKVIISLVKRSEKMFEKINLNKEEIKYLCLVLGVEDKNIIAYFEKVGEWKSIEVLSNYILNYTEDENLERVKALVKERYYEDSVYYKDKIKSVVKFLSTKEPDHLVEFKNMYESYVQGGGDFENFIYLLYNIISREIPDYVKDDLRVYLNREYEVRASLLKLKIVKVTSFNQIVKEIIKLK